MNTVTLSFRTSTLALLLAALVSIFIFDTRSRNKALARRRVAEQGPHRAQPIKNFAPRNPWDKSAQGEPSAPKQPPRTPSSARPPNPFTEKYKDQRTATQMQNEAVHAGAEFVAAAGGGN